MQHRQFLFFCLMIVLTRAYGDDYSIARSPTYPVGMKVEEPFKKPDDPKVCRLYLENLRYFARRDTPMSCGRPIAPALQDRIQDVEWEDLSPGDHPELFRQIVAAAQNWRFRPPKDEKNALHWYADAVMHREHVFRRAKVEFSGYTEHVPENQSHTKPALSYVQYGPNVVDPRNPAPAFRCTVRRGGPSSGFSGTLKLYLVSQDLRSFFGEVEVVPNGGSGEALRVINERPYVETMLDDGNVELMEIDLEYPADLAPVCLFNFE